VALFSSMILIRKGERERGGLWKRSRQLYQRAVRWSSHR